jgi:site-specific DNA-methyltransferase (adenine-specific)
MSSNWRNRIVSMVEVDPRILIPNTLNFKEHPEFQKRVMDATLGEIGWVETVVVNKNTGHIIDGHMRVLLSVEKGEATVPVTYVDLTEEEELKALSTLDPIGDFAKKNSDMVKSLMERITFGNVVLSDLAMKIAQETGSINAPSHTPIPGQESTPKDLSGIDGRQQEYLKRSKNEFSVSDGDIWKCGRHTIICFDCTTKGAIDYIKEFAPKDKMNINTDPPYGIDIVGSDGRIGYGAKFGDVEGDRVPFDPGFILELSNNIVLWGANHYSDRLPKSPSWLVWDKREGDRHNDQADCELAWCSPKGVVRIFHHLWMGFARASERGSERIHPTQKPLALIAWSITEKTEDGAIVYDPYCGSGTTIIACEQTGRVGIGIEKVPDIVSASLLRFREATSIIPRKVGKI